VQAWTGLRCVAADRRPLLGELAPGLWLSTAMGSRGLTFAMLCAELLAARLHGEPLPLPRKLAQALDARRRPV
ncbi:MAG: FAD-dependent oxidoreductase, partial [Comamonadaceae bacterium]